MAILVVILFTFHRTKHGIFNLEPEFDESKTYMKFVRNLVIND